MRKLLTKGWLVRHALVVLVVIVLINLGLWQLRRLDERRALNAAILAGLNGPVTTLTGADVDPNALDFHRVTATGEFDNAQSLVLRNQPFDLKPGVHLITPLRLAGSQRAVLVDRGWIPLDNSGQEARQVYDETGRVTVDGIAAKSQPRPDRFLVPTDPTPAPPATRLDEWFRVDIDRIQAQVPYPLLPIFIKQSPDKNAQPNTPPLRVETIDLSEGPHLGYALQWFSFVIILLVVYGALLRRELKR
jgi:surfeit locus 1 family protein